MAPKSATSMILATLWLISLSIPTYFTVDNSEDVWHHNLGVARVSDKPDIRSITPSKPKQDGEEDHVNSQGESTLNSTACDFRGRKMRIAVSPQPPLVNCLQNLLGEWNCNGSNIEVVNVLAERFNFQPEWIVLTNNQWNSPPGNDPDTKQRHESRLSTPQIAVNETSNQPEGNNLDSFGDTLELAHKPIEYAGVLALVAKGRALMSANGIIETRDRKRDLLISQAFDSFRLHLLLSKSVQEHDHIFVKPFSPQTWAAIMISALMIVPIFHLINTTTSYYDLQDDKSLTKLSFWVCFKFITTELFKTGRRMRFRRRRQRKLSFPFSSSSSSSSFDDRIYRLASAPIALVDMNVQVAPSQGKISKQMRRFLRQRRALDRKRAKKLAQISRKSGFFTVAYLIWYVVSSLANQGGETEDLPTANSTRVLVAFWWLYLIVVVAVHAGILTAILTFPKQNDYIQTLDDYLELDAYERSIMRLSVDKNSEIAHFLSNEDNLHKSPLQLILLQAAKESPLYNMDGNFEFQFHRVDFMKYRARILDEIQVGRSALIEDKSTIDQIVTQEYFDHKPPKCHFKSSRYAIDVVPMHFVLSKTLLSPTCLQSFNSILSSIMKTGLAIKWRRRFESPGNDCLNTVIINAGDVDKIEYRHVEAAFWLLMVGLLIGAIALTMELIWLLTIDDESEGGAGEDDNADPSSTTNSGSNSSSESSGENSDDSIKLGYRIAKSSGGTSQVRSLNIKRRLKKFKLQHPISSLVGTVGIVDGVPDIPTIVLPIELSTNVMDELHENQLSTERRSQIRKRKKLAKAAERRSRRLKRTLDLVKRLHEGKIYSQKLKQRVRRVSQVIVSEIMPSSVANRRGSNRLRVNDDHKYLPPPTTTRRRNLSAVAPERLGIDPAW